MAMQEPNAVPRSPQRRRSIAAFALLGAGAAAIVAAALLWRAPPDPYPPRTTDIG